MLVGHFAPALALRASSKRVPLYLLVLATQAVDVGFFLLVFADVEAADVRPGEHPVLVVTRGMWTHSLAMTAVYAAVCVAVGAALRRPREGALVALALASHWFTDLLVHVPDLPLTLEQETAVGFGLWRVPYAATALEIVLVVAGTAWLHRALSATPRAQKRLLVFAAVLVAIQLVSDLAFPTPETDVELGPAALALYALATGLAFWVERAPQSSIGPSSSPLSTKKASP